jgi:ribosomal-protein-alanine N-acetyltransferase
MSRDTKTKKAMSTPRLLLRSAMWSDVPDLHECFTDPELMRFWSSAPHTSLEETEKWVQGMILSKHNGYSDFIIVDVAADVAIGKIGIWSGNEIGFMIASAYWRKGLISEALGAVLPYYFEELGLERITADVDPRNEASLAILRKFGFAETGRREKTFEIGGVWVDSVDLALTHDGWVKPRG